MCQIPQSYGGTRACIQQCFPPEARFQRFILRNGNIGHGDAARMVVLRAARPSVCADNSKLTAPFALTDVVWVLRCCTRVGRWRALRRTCVVWYKRFPERRCWLHTCPYKRVPVMCCHQAPHQVSPPPQHPQPSSRLKHHHVKARSSDRLRAPYAVCLPGLRSG